jgi:peptidoglycan/LPS O-acetylase OafA/YrhL
MNSTLNRKTYVGIDIWKFIMAFAVVAIHSRNQTYAFGQYSECVTWFISLAVPFFFIVSGFLLAQKLEKIDDVSEKRAVLLARSKQMCRLYISWLIVYLPITVYLTLENGKVWYKAIASYLSQALFYGQSAYAWPLWYIYSMAIVCYLLYKFFYKSHKSRIFLVVSFVGAAIVVASNFIPNIPVIGIPNSLCSRALGGVFDARRNVLI